jgi:hypothetical protein
MEDLVFYHMETTKAICECAGGIKIRMDQPFQFIVDLAKADSPGLSLDRDLHSVGQVFKATAPPTWPVRRRLSGS